MFGDLEMDFKIEIEEYVVENLDTEKPVIPNKKLRRSTSRNEITPQLGDDIGQGLGLIEKSHRYRGGESLELNQNEGDLALRLNKEVLGPTRSQHSEIDEDNAFKEENATTQNKMTLEENLLTFLKGDGDGKLILKHFNDHKSFNTETRSLLTRTIIKKIKDDALRTLEVGQMLTKFTIDTPVFIALSKAIENLFPGESASTYYTPYKTENGISVQTTGTLWAHFNYVVKKLRSQNLLKRRKLKKDETLVVHPQSDEIKLTLNTLENCRDPSTCLSEWQLTHKARQILLLVDKLPIADYMKKFPCLKAQNAKPLIELDFNSLHPGKSHLLQMRWPSIKTILIKQFQILDSNQRKKKKLSIDDLTYIKLLPTLECEYQDAVVLHLLQLLIRTAPPGKRKKDESPETPKKYNHIDIRDTFIYRVEKPEDIDEELQRLNSKVFGREETLHPIIVVVGPLIEIEEAYVVINEQKYKVASCLDALELCFKTFFALHCDYPKPTVGLWQFIQYVAYDIQIVGDTLIKSVKELLGLAKQAFLEASIPRTSSITCPTTTVVGSNPAADAFPDGLQVVVKIEVE